MSLEDQQNITYRRRRYRNREEEQVNMGEPHETYPGKNPADEKEDMVIKGLLRALEDLAASQ